MIARPNGLRKKAETAISCRDLRFRVGTWTYQKEERDTSGRVEEGVDAHVCPCGTTKESRTHIVG